MTILTGFLNFGSLSTGAVFVYTFGANAFFLVSSLQLIRVTFRVTSLLDQLRSLKYVLLPDPSSTTAGTSTLSHAQRSRRVQFLFVMAMSQVLWMGWLSRV